MNRQQQLDEFLFQAHELALSRLRVQPERLQEVLAVLSRWREQSGPTRSDAYLDEWKRLASLGVNAMQAAVCVRTDRAAALRNVSPLSILMSQRERSELLRRARQTA